MAQPNPSFYKKVYAIPIILFPAGGAVFYATAENYNTHMLVFSIIVTIFMILAAIRVGMKEKQGTKSLGEAVVQGGWLWTSFSLVYITLSPAKIYGLSTTGLGLIEVIGVILLVTGVYVLLKAKKETGVMLTV